MARTKQRHLHHYSILATDVCLFCTKYKEVEEPGWRLTEWQLLSHLPEDQRSHLLRSKTGSRYMNSSRNVKLSLMAHWATIKSNTFLCQTGKLH